MEKKSKKGIIIGITSLLLVTLVLLGLTYAYYRTRIIGNESTDPSISVQSKKMEVTYEDGTATLTTEGKIEPGFTATKQFNVKNTGSETVTFSIKLDNVVNGFNKGVEKRGEYFDWKYYLYSGTEENVDNLIKSGDITFETEQYILESVSIDKEQTLQYLLKVEYVNLTDIDQSADMGSRFSLRVNIDQEFEQLEGETISFALTKGIGWDPTPGLEYWGNVVEKQNAKLTDYIPCSSEYKYTVTENQTYQLPEGSGSTTLCILFDENKNAIYPEAYVENRKETRVYTHEFIPTEDAKYFRIQFRITDTDIKITKTKIEQNVLYESNNFIQGITASKDYLFISSSDSTFGSEDPDKNDYRIKKLNRTTGEVLATSTEAFNHANGMAYNSKTNELVINALDGRSGTSNQTNDNDYSLFVADADSLTLKRTINLKDVILDVNSESIGISGVAYNANYDEYYVLTRMPERYIIILDSNFEKKSEVYLGAGSSIPGTLGDIYADDNYFYVPIYRNDLGNYSNEVKIYDKTGKLVKTKTINGLSHIESITKVGNTFYVAFLHSNFVNSITTKVYSMNEIMDIK